MPSRWINRSRWADMLLGHGLAGAFLLTPLVWLFGGALLYDQLGVRDPTIWTVLAIVSLVGCTVLFAWWGVRDFQPSLTRAELERLFGSVEMEDDSGPPVEAQEIQPIELEIEVGSAARVRPDQTCPYCQDTLGADPAALTHCGACSVALHRECLQELKSCPTPGCRNHRRRKRA